ncbi:MAG: DUF5011 domain-containing protein [Sulfurovum sp.]
MKNFSNKMALLLFATLTLFTLSGCGGTSAGDNDGVTDTTKPIITLTGDSIVNIVQGITYSDAGALANDTVDGNITAKIVKGGDTVDTSKTGKYTITYDVTDKAGNQAIQIKRVVNICVPITHNGTAEYCPVTSPNTDRVWLNKNLGAARACESADDVACYGDYYQWGRNFDGHEDSISSITATRTIDINNAGNEFIIATDWSLVDADGSLRSNNWSKTDGTSICPVGYRVPTGSELEKETTIVGVFDKTTAFNSFLKLPSSGVRIPSNGSMVGPGTTVTVWTSSHNATLATSTLLTNSFTSSSRGMGAPVRCIKH